MADTITMEEAQAKLPDLIHNLTPGEEIVITEHNQPVAKLVSEAKKTHPACVRRLVSARALSPSFRTMTNI